MRPGRAAPGLLVRHARGGDLIVWEHLGMLEPTRSTSVVGSGSANWYAKNGFAEGKTLFTSTEEDGKGLDSAELKKTALAIQRLLE